MSHLAVKVQGSGADDGGMIRRALTTAAVAAAIVAAPGIASAAPVSDPTTPVYCGPGQTWVGVNGDANGCARTVLPPDHADDAGIFGAIGAAFAVAWFLF